MIKKLLITIPLVGILIAIVVVGVQSVSDKPVEKKVDVPEVLIDVTTVIPEGTILMDTLTKVSPDQKYTAFVTATDKGFADSTLWVTDNSGELTKIDYQIDLHAFYSAISWNEDGTKFAYLRIYPTEIIVVDIAEGFYRTKILSKIDGKDDNILNPSVGYQGSSYLKWGIDDEIQFENNLGIPAKLYAVNANTKEVTFIQNIDNWKKDNIETIESDSEDSFFSQRDPKWEGNKLGLCSDQTIGSAGCAIASVNMALGNLGLIGENPKTLNELLTANSGYVNECDVVWYTAPAIFKGFIFKGAYGGNNFERLDYELSLGHAVILGFDKVPFTGIPHWVVVREKISGKYFVSDPWGYEEDLTRTLDDLGGNFDHMIVYEKD